MQITNEPLPATCCGMHTQTTQNIAVADSLTLTFMQQTPTLNLWQF